jgi:hypothetical protein
MRKLLLLSLLAMVSIFVHAGENDLCWDYTNKDIPSAGPDNGLYYAGYVNDGEGKNLGLHGNWRQSVELSWMATRANTCLRQYQ